MPFMPGMCTSRNTTSGWCCSNSCHRLAAVARLGHDLELGPQPRELRGQPLAQQRLVVGDEGSRRVVTSMAAGRRVARAGRWRACSLSSSCAPCAKERLQTRAQVGQPGAGLRRCPHADARCRSPTPARAASASRSARTSMRAAVLAGSMPWRTAFSTSVSSAIGGKRSPRNAGSTSIVEAAAGRACASASARGRRAPGSLRRRASRRRPAAAAARRAGRR